MTEYEKLINEGYKPQGPLDVDLSGLDHFDVTEGNNPDRDNRRVKYNETSVSSLFFGKNKQGIILKNGEYISVEEINKAIEECLSRLDQGSIVVTEKGVYFDLDSLVEVVALAAGQLLIKGKNEKIKNQDAYNWSVIGADDDKEHKKGTVWLGNKGIKLKNGTYINAEEMAEALKEYMVLTPEVLTPPIPGPIPIPNPHPIPEPKPTPGPTTTPEPGPGLTPEPGPGLTPEPGPGLTPEPGPGSIPTPRGIPDPSNIPEAIPTPPPIVPPKYESFTHNMARVVKKYQDRASAWLCLLALAATLSTGIKIGQKKEVKNVPVKKEIEITQMIEKAVAKYGIDGLEESLVTESPEQVVQRLLAAQNLGDKVTTKDGDTFNTNSLFTGIDKSIGKEFSKEGKFAGDYEITGFAISHNGKLLTYIQNFDQENISANLGDMLTKVAQKFNIHVDELQVSIHLGGNKDATRLGWIDAKDIIKNNNDLTPQVIGTVMEKVSSFTGVEDNFNGKTITINTPSGSVTLNVVDQNGNLLPSGSQVTGSDGKTYALNNLQIENINTMETTSQTVIQNEMQEVVTGKKLVWNIQDCSLGLAVAPLVAAMLFAIANKKKNEIAQQQPTYFDFKDEEEYQKFLEEFKDSQDKFHKKSSFGQTLYRIFIQKEIDLFQNLTPEQINELYRRLKSYQGPDYAYHPDDRFQFKNGRIYLLTKDEHIQDITDVAIKIIADIGKDNEVIAEGRLEGMEDYESRGR